MSTSAIVTMSAGMVAIWGGLAASIVLTVRRARVRAAQEASGDPDP